MVDNEEPADDEKVFVGGRIPRDKRERIEDTMAYGDTLQEWLEDAIDRKLEDLETEDSGNPQMATPAVN